MIDWLWQTALSNVCVAFVLAATAAAFSRRNRWPHVAHTLWIMVLLKLVTPPIIMVPVAMPRMLALTNAPAPTAPAEPSRSAAGSTVNIAAEMPASTAPAPMIQVAWQTAKPWLLGLWLLGSTVVLLVSTYRVFRFTRLLKKHVPPPEHRLQAIFEQLAKQFGLHSLPHLVTTAAPISPMVWWVGGRVQIVVPTRLVHQLRPHQLRCVLAHELAHVSRYDYLVRWLEWLTCVGFWWYPMVWFAQHELRQVEEICCDAQVLKALRPPPRTYADALLAAVEILAHPVIRPPAMASEVNSGGFLERRFRMIVGNHLSTPRSRVLQLSALLCTLVILPLGIVRAGDYDAVAKRLRAAVTAGEITGQQARAMLSVLKKPAGQADHAPAAQRAKIYLEQLRAKLAAAVKEGDMKEEEAEKKLAEAERAMRARVAAASRKGAVDAQAAVSRPRAYLARLKEELGDQVKAGKISKEEAAERLEIATRRVRQRTASARSTETSEADVATERARAYLKQARMKIAEAVESGQISRAAAKRRMEGAEKAIRERLAVTHRDTEVHERDRKSDIERIEREIREAVKDGKISAEEARKKMQAIRKKIGAVAAKGRVKQLDWAGMNRRVEAAVKRGDITRAQAKEKYEAIRKMMAKKFKEKKKDGDRPPQHR